MGRSPRDTGRLFFKNGGPSHIGTLRDAVELAVDGSIVTLNHDDHTYTQDKASLRTTARRMGMKIETKRDGSGRIMFREVDS